VRIPSVSAFQSVGAENGKRVGIAARVDRALGDGSLRPIVGTWNFPILVLLARGEKHLGESLDIAGGGG
jgi:hypothetical protein